MKSLGAAGLLLVTAVLTAPAASTTSYLVSTDGLLVHSWTSAFRPGAMGYLLENGHLLRSARLTVVDSRWLGVAAAGGRVEEYDWDGSLLWEFEYSSPDHLTHHDMKPLPNGNVLLVAWEVVSVNGFGNGRNYGVREMVSVPGLGLALGAANPFTEAPGGAEIFIGTTVPSEPPIADAGPDQIAFDYKSK